MWIITVNGKSHLWSNNVSDDFLQYLPDHFGVMPHQIEVHCVTDAAKQRELKAFVSGSGSKELQCEPGKITKMEFKGVNVLPPSLNEGDDDPDKPGKKVPKDDPRTKPQIVPDYDNKGEITAKKLKKWPYDEDGKFLGNDFE